MSDSRSTKRKCHGLDPRPTVPEQDTKGAPRKSKNAISNTDDQPLKNDKKDSTIKIPSGHSQANLATFTATQADLAHAQAANPATNSTALETPSKLASKTPSSAETTPWTPFTDLDEFSSPPSSAPFPVSEPTLTLLTLTNTPSPRKDTPHPSSPTIQSPAPYPQPGSYLYNAYLALRKWLYLRWDGGRKSAARVVSYVRAPPTPLRRETVSIDARFGNRISYVIDTSALRPEETHQGQIPRYSKTPSAREEKHQGAIRELMGLAIWFLEGMGEAVVGEILRYFAVGFGYWEWARAGMRKGGCPVSPTVVLSIETGVVRPGVAEVEVVQQRCGKGRVWFVTLRVREGR